MPISDVKHGIISRRTEGSFRYHAWGSVAKLIDGTIVAACSGGRNWHICPFGKTLLFLSKDEGSTWSCPIVVNDTWMDDRDVGLTSLPNGGLLLTWFTAGFELLDAYDQNLRGGLMDEGEYEMVNAYRKTCIVNPNMVKGCYSRVSYDNGLTWSEPRPTPVTAPHGPTVMNDGSLLYFGRADEPEAAIEAWRSVDDGFSWSKLGTVPVPEDWTMQNFHEPHALQLPNGRIVGIIRFERPIPGQCDFLSMFITFSDDGGKTWSMPKDMGCDGAPPHLMLHSSGALICSYGRRVETYPQDLSERALVSWDGGITWTEDLTLLGDGPDWDLGYPSTVELSDGSLLTAYYQKYRDSCNADQLDDKASFLFTKWKLTNT